MSENNLIPSLVLFRELYDQNKHNIYNILAQFIRASISIREQRCFTLTGCVSDLKEQFGFDIPESVVKSCIKNRLIRHHEVTPPIEGEYWRTEQFNELKEFSNAHKNESELLLLRQNILDFAKENLSRVVSISDEKIINFFNKYILEESIPEEYSQLFSTMIIKERIDKNLLNKIKEGLILYAGIKNQSPVMADTTWNSELTIFLDVEVLFHAACFNGELYKKIFFDFYNLCQETRKQKPGGIVLRYFEETKREIYNFFYAAECVVEQNKIPEPGKTAMRYIVNGCKTKSDVIEKKTKFFLFIKELGIQEEIRRNYYSESLHKFNIEDKELINKLADRLDSSQRKDSLLQDISDKLKLLTKINVIRNGDLNLELKNCKAIFISESRLISQLVFSNEIRERSGKILFATQLEFMTEQLWFVLNKGFGDRTTPLLFDVVNKAKVVLSSILNKSISEAYIECNKEFNKQTLTQEEAALLLTELRSKSYTPEEITPEKFDDAISYLKSDFVQGTIDKKNNLEKSVEVNKTENTRLTKKVEDVTREKLFLEEKNQKLNSELAEIKKEKKKERKEKIAAFRKNEEPYFYLYTKVLPRFILVILFGICAYVTWLLREDGDTKLGIIGFIISISGIFYFFEKTISPRALRFGKKRYRKNRNALNLN